jgi:hypothetical protein
MGASPARRWKHAMTDYLDSVFVVRATLSAARHASSVR